MWRRVAATLMILMVLMFSEAHSVVAQNTNFSFPAQNGASNFLVSEDARNDAQNLSMNLQVAAATGNSSPTCGRVVYERRVRMVDKASATAASFSTSFTFSFASHNNDPTVCGDGMMFMFSANSNLSDHEKNLAGGSLCELDYNLGSNLRLFSVEFDSYHNTDMPGDVSDSHISVDYKNLVFPSNSYNLCSNSTNITNCDFFCKDPNAKYTAWIDYDSAGQTLEVRFIKNGSIPSVAKPADAVIAVPNLRLDEVLDEEMFVGFIGSSGGGREVHTIWSWEFVSSGMPNQSSSASSGLSPGLIGGVCAAVVGGILVAGLLCFCVTRHRNKSMAFKQLTPPLPSTAPFEDDDDSSRPYTFMELSSMTKFNESELLSSGGFGDVYRGTLPNGAQVAIKRIKENKEQGLESFLAEARSLRQTRHKHLLHLRGWSNSPDGMFLVYDFMCNGSLDKWIYPTPSRGMNESEENDFVDTATLSWNQRQSILVGVASGLKYLHNDGKQCVLHRDIKSSNVLLDEDFRPYLGDFGLARLMDHSKMHKTTKLVGTWGYMAPEMLHTQAATKETDVYAFGILMLEVVCGRRPVEMKAVDEPPAVLLETVWRAHENRNILQVADPKLSAAKPSKVYQFQDAAAMAAREADEHHVMDLESVADGAMDREKEMMENVLQIGLLCCLPNPSDRPTMEEVNQWFQSSTVGRSMTLPPLPASNPHNSQYSASQYPSDGSHSSLSSSLVAGR